MLRVTRCPGTPASLSGQTKFPSFLEVERFDYVRLGEQISLVRLLSRISDERRPPAGAKLCITRGEERTEHIAGGCVLDRSSGPDSRRATGLLWRASFVVPLEIVENPSSLFELSDLTGVALILPRPEPCIKARLGTAELRGRVGSRYVLRRLGTLATVVTVAAAYSPGLGFAGTSADPSWAPVYPHAITGEFASRKSQAAARKHPRRPGLGTHHPTKRVRHAKASSTPTATTTTPAAATPALTPAQTKTAPAPAATPSTGRLNPGAGVKSRRGSSWAHQPSLLIPSGSPTPGGPPPRHLPGATHKTTTPHGTTHHRATPSRPPAKLTETPPVTLSSPPAQIDSGASIPSALSPAVKAGLAAELKLLSKTLQSGDQPPVFLIHIYKAAQRTYHVPWKILAAINAIETNYGRNLSVSSAGAIGWMQFMPDTWRRYGTTPSGHGKPNPFDPRDAIFSAARYLAANGARHDLPRSLFAYNHATWYVDEVLLKARTITNGGGTIKHPHGAPEAVAKVIEAGNSIATDPYIWGGGHASFLATGYDCSGSVSYALAAAGLLKAPMVSGQFESWGKPGPGKWITIYATAGHVWMTIAGWRFDTVALGQTGTRWAPSGGELPGYVVRHPAGL